jgi:ubiquinone/menaquinone biosynthesis C-methylase UbiE
MVPMTGDPVVDGVATGDDEPAEKTGMRNAWGRIAVAYDEMFAERMTHLTRRGLDLLAPEAHWDGLDIACGPGLTTAALADRLPAGRTLGIDFAEPMIARARERFSRPGLEFAVDDAERLSQPTGTFGAVTCSFGLMYCYDARGALGHMARVVSPGGRLMVLVWGRAANVWWSPVIELIETRAEYYASVCPMMFFYGLPGVLGRMVGEAELAVTHDEAVDERMAFPSIEEAVNTAVLGGPLAGLYTNRLDAQQQGDVRRLLTEHLSGLAETSSGEVLLPAEIRIVVAEKRG